MNAKWIVPLLVASVAGVLAFGLARNTVCQAPAPEIDRLQDVSFLSRELKLTDAQASEIQKLHTNLATRLGDCCARHCGARMRLGQALAAETNDDTRVEAALAEMCRAYEASERSTLDHIRQLRTLLNAEQRRRFDALISDCMCQSCSRHGCTEDAKEALSKRRVGE